MKRFLIHVGLVSNFGFFIVVVFTSASSIYFLDSFFLSYRLYANLFLYVIIVVVVVIYASFLIVK